MNPMTDYRRSAPRPRRDHKDTLFRMLFRDRKNLLELYNAVNRTSYTDPEQLTVVTLENAVYMNMKNDVAFLADFRLNLYEHQSTWNPNMPLRDLFYVAREYQALTKAETLYTSRLIKIPAPNFIVFYNGEKDIGDSCVLKLSDAFEQPTVDPELELKVKVLKIAPGQNTELLDTCQALREYMLFVERVRLHARETDTLQAVDQAVTECIREGILSDFLSRNRAEAIAVSIFEYDEEREMALIKKAIAEEEREKCQEEMRAYQAELHAKVLAEGREKGLAEGRAEGHAEGRAEGLAEGHTEGRMDEVKDLIRTKLRKGKSVAIIADELERDEAVIEKLIREMKGEKKE